ncbi:MAG TPA: hypothetical protein VJ783_05880 [Pirellulales bacterium]|nr:hypothetical protein [Pirellulales bacterium]
MLAVVQAQPPRPTPDDQARRLLVRAGEALARRKSVSANLSQTVRLYGQELLGRGSYLQGPVASRWLLLDLTIKMKESEDAVVQQRCDGETLWTLRSVDALPTLTRVDVQRVIEGRAAQPGAAVPVIGVGGLAELLLALERSFEFDAVHEAKLTRPSETLAVYALSGRWRPAMLARWLPEQKAAIEAGQPADLTKLPPMLPDRVFVLLGRDDLFLYRVEYVREASGKGRKSDGPFVSLNLGDVVFDEPVDRRQFVFERGTLPAIDQTEAYLAREQPSPPQ